MPDNQKPAGYYDEIACTWSKSVFLLEHFKEYNPSIHTNADADYDYLEEKECTVVIRNPICEHHIEFEMAGEFSLFFAGWHCHYYTYEYDFSEMVRDAENIIGNRCCVIVVKRGDAWVGSCFSENTESIDAAYIKDRFKCSESMPEELRHEIDFNGCIANVHFWDNARDFEVIMDE